MSIEPSYLDLLRATLAYDEARRARAAELLNDDDDGYRELVLTQWDRVIAQDKARIADEEAKNHADLR